MQHCRKHKAGYGFHAQRRSRTPARPYLTASAHTLLSCRWNSDGTMNVDGLWAWQDTDIPDLGQHPISELQGTSSAVWRFHLILQCLTE